MDISLPALVSILALVILVGISCVNEDLNVGFLGIAFGIIVGGIFSDISAAKIMNAFPLSLFMILVGVTFLFGMAQTNGTMEKLTAYSVRACKGNTALVPLIIYVLCTFVTTIGPGNIAGCALMAPVSMAIASKVKMPAFLMTLLVVGACNGAAFSPFAPTGIISNGLIAKMAGELGLAPDYLNTLAWKIHFNSELAQGFVNIGGFFVMGGLKWNHSVARIHPYPLSSSSWPAWYERRIPESCYQHALQRRFYLLRSFYRTYAHRLWRLQSCC